MKFSKNLVVISTVIFVLLAIGITLSFAQGPPDPPGPPGRGGVIGFYQREATLTCPSCPFPDPLVVSCDPGDVATGGTGHINSTPNQDIPNRPWPVDINQPPTGWAILPRFEVPGGGGLQVIVICADMTP